MHATTATFDPVTTARKTDVRGILSRSPMLLAFVAAVFVSLILFALLYAAIHAGEFVADKREALQTIDFVRLKRDSETETLSRRKPPPPPAQPPPPAKMRVAAEAVQQGPSAMEIPSLNLAATVGGGPIGGQVGKGGGAMFDGDLLPLQRIPPQYPRDAARGGITGWVQLEVLVNADGSVRSAKVTDAKPRGIFEASAVQAVMRWKFKPKIQDGKPVEQRGSQKIEFNLNAAAG
ncbi:MAG TPA: energy transducer TonB [Povalibacter sp.]|uniref:energy transducer TonB n=1 Tax=Povalibacter sp. TaxID=1962978 RepID=UPI002C37690D|nr:energy transducer TonB [Povalibacter sp.]HMN43683.1 energy transducer TonB [Povalibacter sp.]